MRLAIISTHPIQYYAPVFKLLHERREVEINVFYTWGEDAANKYDPGFKKIVEWDIPLLEGYPYEWVKNTSMDPGSHHFKGIFNPGLIKQVQEWKPDAVLIYGWAYNSHLKALRYFKNKIPVFFRGDSTLLDEKKGVKTILKTQFLKWVYHHVDYVFYVGTNNKAYFKKYGLKDNQLIFAPHAIDNSRFGFDKSEQGKAIRQELGIMDDEILILFAGKLEQKKAPLQLLEAFGGLQKEGVYLLFTGNGVLEETLKDKSKNIKNVRFKNFQNQSLMPALYQACDLFCLPSVGPGETWGLAINEAMACKKAILVSDKVGGAIDLVTPGYNGAIFTAGSTDNLSTTLDNLISQGKAGLADMGIRSMEIIKFWNFENQVKAIETLVKRIQLK